MLWKNKINIENEEIIKKAIFNLENGDENYLKIVYETFSTKNV